MPANLHALGWCLLVSHLAELHNVRCFHLDLVPQAQGVEASVLDYADWNFWRIGAFVARNGPYEGGGAQY
jgi:hypothetical protein